MFEIIIENTETLLEFFSKPSIVGYNDKPIHQRIGYSTLPWPLENIDVFFLSTGKKVRLEATISATKEGKTFHPIFPFVLYTSIRTSDMIKFEKISDNELRVYDKGGNEKFAIFANPNNNQLLISAGSNNSPSGPTIDTENTENLLHDICIFADVIEAIINDYYNIICLSNVMHQEKENKKENPDKKNLDILKLALDKLKKIIAMEVVLYLRSPLENDDAFDDPDIEIGLDTNRDNNDGDIGTRDLHNRKGKVHKEVRPEEIQYTLDDVAGIEEQKNQVTEILDFLEEPERFTKLGAEIPKGVLLSGPPGTGKTMLAQAIAKEANIPFFAMDGSAFVEIYVGVGAGRVRDLFNKAKKKAPSIVFIDEIDAIAGSRNASSGSSGEREQALNQLLAKMDGFEGNSGVIVMGATNRQDMLDSAILSRFNRQIVIPNPDIDAREAILKVHTRNKPLENDVDLRHLARGTNRFSGRDLKNILNEAALLAVRRKKEAISADEIKEAYNTVLMGSERKIKHMRKEDLLRTAYHEAGHALLYEIYPEIDSVTQITIVPRGLALGLTWHLSDEERYHTTKRELFCELQAQLGGRAAEMVIFGDDYVTTGASKDIKRSTNTVKNMIMKWGMSKELGIPYYGGGDYHENLGYRVGNDIQISPKTQQKIDTAVKDILENMLRKAVEQLNKHRKALEALTEALLLKKTLDGDEVRRIIKENPSTVVLPEPEEVEIKHYWHIMY